MALQRGRSILVALTLLIVVAWLTYDLRRSPTTRQPPPPDLSLQLSPNNPSHDGDDEVAEKSYTIDAELHSALCHYGVCEISPDASVSYARIRLSPLNTRTAESPLLQDINVSMPPFAGMKSTNDLDLHVHSHQRAIVEVPPPLKPADASNLIFGVATNVDRLEDSLHQFAHWAADNGARIIALLPHTSSSTDIQRTSEKSISLGLNMTILTSELEFDDRYFHLASLMHNYSTSTTTWASLIDDDTFFPSMNTLQAMLSKYPSPVTNPHYVGALSEDFHQLFKWGYMGYGGGGVFVSFGLLNQLLPHLEVCAQLRHTGDARLAQCIFSHTTTKLSPERDLYQVDLWGDASGFYEALRPQPVSVHHWKSWHKFDMVNISRVSSVCGDSCIFQKYRFADDWQLTNGFSLVKYSAGHERNATDERMEKTWWDSQGGTLDMFLHSVSPLRLKDPNKIQYLLEGSILEDGTVRQFYVKRSHGVDGRQRVQIVEVMWTKKEQHLDGD